MKWGNEKVASFVAVYGDFAKKKTQIPMKLEKEKKGDERLGIDEILILEQVSKLTLGAERRRSPEILKDFCSFFNILITLKKMASLPLFQQQMK